MDPNNINRSNVNQIIATIHYYLNSLLENSLLSYYPTIKSFTLPASEVKCECMYLVAMCYIFKEDYKKAANEMKVIVRKAEINNPNVAAFYRAIESYSSSMSVLKNHQKTMEYISLFYDHEIAKKIDYLFCEKDKVLIKQYSKVVDYDKEVIMLEMSECDENIKNYMDKLMEIHEINPISQEDLLTIFKK